jgi:hypothetical protein
MPEDRRRVHRHAVGYPAKIQFDAALPARDCVIADLSQDGVRLVLEGAAIPERFTLLLDDALSRICNVVWRLDDEIGAEFCDSADDGWLDIALGHILPTAP